MRPVTWRAEHLTAGNGFFTSFNARLAGAVKSGWPGALSLLMMLAAIVIWGVSLQQIDILHMSDIGLISALPPAFFLSVALTTVSFVLTLHRRPLSVPLVLLHVVIFVIMLYGVTALVEQVPRFGSAWKHVGITEHVMRTGKVNPEIYPDFS